MELILKQDVENLGFKDDVVTVKNGFGRNYLIPQGHAILATSSANASGNTAITVGGAGGSSTDKFTPPFSLEVLQEDFTSFGAPVTIDLDGNSFKAARFSGELQLESSSTFSTTNDNGTTTYIAGAFRHVPPTVGTSFYPAPAQSRSRAGRIYHR